MEYVRIHGDGIQADFRILCRTLVDDSLKGFPHLAALVLSPFFPERDFSEPCFIGIESGGSVKA